jgi:hypothetical protein
LYELLVASESTVKLELLAVREVAFCPKNPMSDMRF